MNWTYARTSGLLVRYAITFNSGLSPLEGCRDVSANRKRAIARATDLQDPRSAPDAAAPARSRVDPFIGSADRSLFAARRAAARARQAGAADRLPGARIPARQQADPQGRDFERIYRLRRHRASARNSVYDLRRLRRHRRDPRRRDRADPAPARVGQGFCRRAASHRGARTVPRLPLGTAVSAPERVLLGRVRDLLERDLLEQSVTERLVRAACAAVLLWLAIYWALS